MLDPLLCLVSEEEKHQIRMRTGQLVKLAGGPEVFQHSAGVTKSTLSRYSCLSEDDIIRTDVLLALDRQIGAPMMLEFLAGKLGFKLVPIDEPEGGDEVSLADLADLHRADSDVKAGLAEALSDGVVDINERRATRAAIARKMARLHKLDRKLARGA